MPIDTFVAGIPDAAHQAADAMRQHGEHVHDCGTGFHKARVDAEAEWKGAASSAFQGTVESKGRAADQVVHVVNDVAGGLSRFGQDLGTVKARMEQAKAVARSAGLTVLTESIPDPLPPKPQGPHSTDIPLIGPPGNAQAQEQEAQAAFARQQAAYAEAQGIVGEARGIEKQAHEALHEVLRAASSGLDEVNAAQQWSQGAPPGSTLTEAAGEMEAASADATRGALERCIAGGPQSVHGAWGQMTTAQQADLIARYPQLIGSTNGIPAVERDKANRSLMIAQKKSLDQLIARLQGELKTARMMPDGAGQTLKLSADLSQAQEAKKGLDDLERSLSDGHERYLLGIDATGNSRGRFIVASGNPDQADHVLTYIPGTGSDLGGASSEIQRQDNLLANGQKMSPDGRAATITWCGYESPPGIMPAAAVEKWANAGKGDLAEFQEGLRATHEGAPSHNTVLGHSYGSTLAGYAQRDHGLHADELAMIGSPGAGVSNARELGMPPEHIWAGRSERDIIALANSVDAFGPNPAGPDFGARQIQVDNSGGHSDYFAKQESMDSLSRIMMGR